MLNVGSVLRDRRPGSVPGAARIARGRPRGTRGRQGRRHGTASRSAAAATSPARSRRSRERGAGRVRRGRRRRRARRRCWKSLHEADPHLAPARVEQPRHELVHLDARGGRRGHLPDLAAAAGRGCTRRRRGACSPTTRASFHEAGRRVGAVRLRGDERRCSTRSAAPARAATTAADVISSYFATRDRDSVLGRYSVTPEGETTLRRFGVYRVQDGAPVFDRAVDSALSREPRSPRTSRNRSIPPSSLCPPPASVVLARR